MKENHREKVINIGSERNIISIALQNPNKVIDLEMHGFEPKHFLMEANQYIYMSIVFLISKDTKPTALAIMETLNGDMRERVEEMGGSNYLLALENAKVNDDNMLFFADNVITAHTKYRMLVATDTIQENILKDKDIETKSIDVVQMSDEIVTDIRADIQVDTKSYKMGDSIREVMEERKEQTDIIPGLESGFTKFDAYTNGGRPGDLIMICARSKVGKSVVLTNIATNMAIIGDEPVLYIDTEMNERDQEDRIIARLSDIPESEIISGMCYQDTEVGTAEEKIERLNKAMDLIEDGKLFYHRMPSFNIESISALVKQYKLRHDISAVFFDYLKLPSSEAGSLATAQEWQLLGFVASGLKELAGELDIPIYSACQENRSDSSGKKSYHNVGGSDRILQLATKLIFLENKPHSQIHEEGGLLGNQELYIAYQRNGMSDCEPININFNRPYLRMEEV